MTEEYFTIEDLDWTHAGKKTQAAWRHLHIIVQSPFSVKISVAGDHEHLLMHDGKRALGCPCEGSRVWHKLCRHQKYLNYALDRRNARLGTSDKAEVVAAKSNVTVESSLERKMIGAPLNGNSGFNMYR